VRLKKPHDRIYMKRAHNWGNQKDLVASGIAPPKDAAVYHPCILPWSTMNITTSGAVSLCPQDYDGNLEIGDVRTHTIEKIWRNASWSWIRRLHASGERNTLPLCRGCRLFDLDFSLEAARDEEKRELYDN
jgi:radical SAM protein with 4Fe4S-binding SPASM domain